MTRKKQRKNQMDYIMSNGLKISKRWRNLMFTKKFSLANKLCHEFIQKNKKELNKYKYSNSEKKYYKLWRLLILFKTMQDYTELSQLTQDIMWHKEYKITEKIWDKKCDCTDRINTILDCCSGVIIDEILIFLSTLEEIFENEFGCGLYASPGFIIDKFVCSICLQDTRACTHINGRLYDGKICKNKPLHLQLDHISAVVNPKDKRCRIWPWNKKEDGTIEMCFLTLFAVDDFLSK